MLLSLRKFADRSVPSQDPRARHGHPSDGALLRPDLQRPDCRMDGRALRLADPLLSLRHHGADPLLHHPLARQRCGQPSQTDDRKKVSRIPLKELFHGVLCKPTFWALCLSFSAFLCNLRFQHLDLHLPVREIRTQTPKSVFPRCSYHQVAAATGVLLGGRISDLLAVRFPRVRIKVVVFGLFLAAPFVYLMGATSTLWVCWPLWLVSASSGYSTQISMPRFLM